MFSNLLLSFFTLYFFGVSFNSMSSETPAIANTPSIASPTSIIKPDQTHDLAYYDKMSKMTADEWKKILTPDQYRIAREAGTETPFSSPLDFETRAGTYYSVGCDQPVFRSEQKYESGTGWPSFWKPISPDALIEKTDNSILFESRTEILDKCGNHLGHVFNDGPQPTGLRYCMNGLALKFVPDESQPS